MNKDNNRILVINMADPKDMEDAQIYISDGRVAGFEVVQRNLVFDKEGSLWAVVWLEIPAESKDEQKTISVQCNCRSCSHLDKPISGVPEPVRREGGRVYRADPATARNIAAAVKRYAADDADTELTTPTTLPDD